MKPEPLKNKKFIADGIKSCASFRIINAKNLKEAQEILSKVYFSEENIKSAVEWLKENVCTLIAFTDVEIKETTKLRKQFHKLIDEAFEDVVKKGEEDKKKK